MPPKTALTRSLFRFVAMEYEKTKVFVPAGDGATPSTQEAPVLKFVEEGLTPQVEVEASHKRVIRRTAVIKRVMRRDCPLI